jgi:chromosome segregation ATPase
VVKCAKIHMRLRTCPNVRALCEGCYPPHASPIVCLAATTQELQNLFLGARLKQQFRAVSKAEAQVNSYKQQANTLSQTESELRGQLSLYAEKFEQFQVTLTKSNEVFNTFKQEMERVRCRVRA